jgi:hypothetical protein
LLRKLAGKSNAVDHFRLIIIDAKQNTPRPEAQIFSRPAFSSPQLLPSHRLFQTGRERTYATRAADVLNNTHIEQFRDIALESKPLHDVAIAQVDDQ